MIISIKAVDTLFFRDGKPFTMGEDNWADGIMLPYPSIIYGALRTAYFARHSDQLSKANTLKDPTRKLVINNIYYKLGQTAYFPMPLDCVISKNNKDLAFNLKLYDTPYASSCPTQKVLGLSKDIKIENLNYSIIDVFNFEDYLSGSINEFYYKKLDDLVKSEPKIGMGRNKLTHSSKDGKLYRIEMKRYPNDFRIIIDFSGLKLDEEGLLKLGGEGKAAAYKVVNNNLNLSYSNIKGNIVKIYLLTPAIFENGWLPGWIDPQTLEGEYKGVHLKLITAAIGKYISIGGFDMKKKRPKTMRRIVPQGSVYYFELINSKIENELINFTNDRSISDYDYERGYGIYHIGGVN